MNASSRPLRTTFARIAVRNKTWKMLVVLFSAFGPCLFPLVAPAALDPMPCSDTTDVVVPQITSTLPPWLPSTGSIKCLLVFVRFRDDTSDSTSGAVDPCYCGGWSWTEWGDRLPKMFADSLLSPTAGPFVEGSITDYFRTMSLNHDAGEGGDVYARDSAPRLEYSTFYGNGTSGAGNWPYSWGTSILYLDHCIVQANRWSFCFHCYGDGQVQLTCTDAYDPNGSDGLGCVVGQIGISGNISADPLFCNPSQGDLSLNYTSPCLSAPGCGPMGCFSWGCGVQTGVEERSHSWGRVKRELAGRRGPNP